MQHKIEKKRHPYMRLKFWLSAPFIYAMIVPAVFLDLCMEIYHHVCFPLYGLPLVRRADHISIIDRAKLPYLRWFEKLNCAYCGYVNGVLRYTCAIAAETERYWCGILHERPVASPPSGPSVQRGYLPYGDEKALRAFESRGTDLHNES